MSQRKGSFFRRRPRQHLISLQNYGEDESHEAERPPANGTRTAAQPEAKKVDLRTASIAVPEGRSRGAEAQPLALTRGDAVAEAFSMADEADRGNFDQLSAS